MRSETEREKSSSDVFMPESSVPMIFCASSLELNLNANDFTRLFNSAPSIFKVIQTWSFLASNVLRSFVRSKHWPALQTRNMWEIVSSMAGSVPLSSMQPLHHRWRRCTCWKCRCVWNPGKVELVIDVLCNQVRMEELRFTDAKLSDFLPGAYVFNARIWNCVLKQKWDAWGSCRWKTADWLGQDISILNSHTPSRHSRHLTISITDIHRRGRVDVIHVLYNSSTSQHTSIHIHCVLLCACTNKSFSPQSPIRSTLSLITPDQTFHLSLCRFLRWQNDLWNCEPSRKQWNVDSISFHWR